MNLIDYIYIYFIIGFVIFLTTSYFLLNDNLYDFWMIFIINFIIWPVFIATVLYVFMNEFYLEIKLKIKGAITCVKNTFLN